MKYILYTGVMCFYIILGCHQKQAKQVETGNKGNRTAMLLGMYHFNNPGKDTYNLEVDDYFTDKRQKEIEEVIKLLKEYKPNKIFVEFKPKAQPVLDSLYKLYVDNKISLKEIKGGQNEVYQIGFKLGKTLGVQQITAVDHDGNWLGDYADFIADTLSLGYYAEYREKQSKEFKERQEGVSKNTVKENLIAINRWEAIMANHAYYNDVAVKVKDTVGIMFSNQMKEVEIDGLPYALRSFDFENIGVELVTEWYKRNLFIYRNILENTQPNDRVLILFGSGHTRYLHQFIEDNQDFNLIAPNKYLEKSSD